MNIVFNHLLIFANLNNNIKCIITFFSFLSVVKLSFLNVYCNFNIFFQQNAYSCSLPTFPLDFVIFLLIFQNFYALKIANFCTFPLYFGLFFLILINMKSAAK